MTVDVYCISTTGIPRKSVAALPLSESKEVRFGSISAAAMTAAIYPFTLNVLAAEKQERLAENKRRHSTQQTKCDKFRLFH